MKCLGEPNLGKHGLYPTISEKDHYRRVQTLINFIAYADGKNDLIAISDLIYVPVEQLIEIAGKLDAAGLLETLA